MGLYSVIIIEVELHLWLWLGSFVADKLFWEFAASFVDAILTISWYHHVDVDDVDLTNSHSIVFWCPMQLRESGTYVFFSVLVHGQ